MDKGVRGQRRKASCCHHCLLTETALYLLHHCLQLRGHHPDLINESTHWVGEKHTCLLHIQKDICDRQPKRLTHTKGLPLLPSLLETDKKGSFRVSTQRGGCGREENTLSETADLIHPQLTQGGEEDFRKWADYVQEKISCKQLTGNLHEKRVLKIHRLLEVGGRAPGPAALQEASEEATGLELSLPANLGGPT